LYENKVDHTTFFGKKIEYIHGIQMMPICPITAYIRSKKFAIEEWQQFFKGNNSSSSVLEDKAWTALLRGNQATFDPTTSFEFFASGEFEDAFMMDGDSRAYYLMYSASLAGL
jgi:endo-1,3(4)-beta-glucanase